MSQIPDHRQQIEDATRHSVKQVFAILGVDIDNPAQVEEFRKDLRFGQTMRRASDKGVMAIVVVVCTGLAVSAWVGIMFRFGKYS